MSFSLATGDFDDDGTCDLAIGVPFEDLSNNTLSAAGAVHVLFGSVGTGLVAQGQQLWTDGTLGSSNLGFERFGYSLTAGDFDGDRTHDLAIGIPRDLQPTLADPSRRPGSVRVLFGAAGGTLGTTSRLLTGGGQDDDDEGWAVSFGDFEGDCRDDLAVGIPGRAVQGRDNAGAVRVWYRPSAGLGRVRNEYWSQAPLPGVTWVGDRFGSSLWGSPDR